MQHIDAPSMKVIVWNLWRVRNSCVFKEGSFDHGRVMNEIFFYTWFWLNELKLQICVHMHNGKYNILDESHQNK